MKSINSSSAVSNTDSGEPIACTGGAWRIACTGGAWWDVRFGSDLRTYRWYHMTGMVFSEALKCSLPSDVGHGGLVASEVEEMFAHQTPEYRQWEHTN